MTLLTDSDYWITRFVFQRALGCIYLFAFAVAVNQFIPLCGENGIRPVSIYMQRSRFWDAPSLFWINHSDRFMLLLGWAGILLSLFAVSGLSDAHGVIVSAVTWSLLWLIYLSFVNVGQTFYAFGWESLLCETGFLAIFFGSSDTKVPVIIIWLLRWLLFRLMFGAGLIKMRGDQCWRDLTCMMYHYETQPMPNPFSWYFHHLPPWIHKGSVLFNHITELAVPFAYFFRGIASAIAGGLTIVFQLLLVFSGNFSWLNWLTIVLCVPCFSDRQLSFLPFRPPPELHGYGVNAYAVFALTGLVLILSIGPALNLLARHQRMNASFEPFHLVNTYGAFGSITKVRQEIVIEGTAEAEPAADWKEYGFKGKPGDLNRTPPWFAPYHLRLDWLMWFLPFSPCEMNPWFVDFLDKLLAGDKAVLGLLKSNPFPDQPPKHIRAVMYEYHYTTPAEKAATGAIWKREQIGLYCPVLSRLESR